MHSSKLQTLAGFPRLESMGTLRIRNNPELADVSQLPVGAQLGGNAEVVSNHQLPGCAAQAAPDGLTVSGRVIIADNLDDGWPDCP
ncbi:MAG: hypothetical protein GY946_07320 [bacterium]|nr:hypothetical protein [bacterium]